MVFGPHFAEIADDKVHIAVYSVPPCSLSAVTLSVLFALDMDFERENYTEM